MTAARLPLFCGVDLAERIERVEMQLVTTGSRAAHQRHGGGAGFVIPIAGGAASYAEADSPLNKVVGLGFGGVPSEESLDEVERAFAACHAPVQIELPHLADPEIGAFLTGRGYRLMSFENVLGIALDGQIGREIDEIGEIERVTPDGVEVRRSGDDELDAWLDVVTEGFAHPDTRGVPSHEDFPREVVARAVRDLAGAADVVRYSALHHGVLAGGGSIRMADGVAQLTGAATAFEHRRRGIQAALLSARLADSAAAGCDIAVVTTQPGSTSQKNAQRRGFDLLYTRAVLVKEPSPPSSVRT